MPTPDQSMRPSIIRAITSPLGFFALSLLIVEGFLAIVLIFSNLEEPHKFWGMLVGAVLFLIVVFAVWRLVGSNPENLTFGEASNLEKLRLQKNWGTSENPVTKEVIEQEPPNQQPAPKE